MAPGYEATGSGRRPTIAAVGRAPVRRGWAVTSVLIAALLGACAQRGGVDSREASPIDASGTSGTSDTSDASDGSDGSDGTRVASTSEAVSSMEFEIEWGESDAAGQTGTLQVPVDYDEPDGPTFSLHLVRNEADDPDARIGSLLVNPGGPGFGGSDYATFADQIYGEPLLDHFDIIGWDPRGTGKSSPGIDCIDDYDRFYAEIDITPDDEAERQTIVDRADEFADACVEHNSAILPFVGTNNAARDMEAIRIALGEDKISYFGFSYGSELGAVWATMFPDAVRAAVFDGAADPTVGLDEGAKLQLAGFESSLDTFLARCSADRQCPFHNGGDAESAFDELMRSLDEDPIPSRPDRPEVNRVVGIQATITALYSTALWPQLERALADAQDGDGNGLIDLYDSYFQRSPDGSWGNELEAFQSIVCMDTIERASAAEEDRAAAELREIAPRLSPGTTGDYFCTFFPEPADPRVEITGEGAGPIVVIGTTGDPATPLEGSRTAAESLEQGVLVVVDADEHTGYTASPCAQEVVHEYLVDLEPPDPGTQC